MRARIGTQVIVGAGLVTTTVTAVVAVLILKAHRQDLVGQVTRSADRLSETIKGSTHYDMLENRRESLHRQIEAIGSQGGSETVRISNREGRIVFSSRPDEIGRSVDKRAEACYACHAVNRPLERLEVAARSRIFESGAGHRVLGIINPIHNQPSCSTAQCHAHRPSDRVLGVLDVTLSLADVDQSVAAGGTRIVVLAAAAIAASSLLLWWLTRRLVVRPVEALARATRRVADGDLTATIPATAGNELGELARDFNEMVRRLGETERQLTQADKLASVGRLAAGVAHEINNPLTGVLTYASFLLKRADSPEARQDLEVVVRETKRCREI